MTILIGIILLVLAAFGSAGVYWLGQRDNDYLTIAAIVVDVAMMMVGAQMVASALSSSF